MKYKEIQILLSVVLFALAVIAPAGARAACIDPVGVEGEILYNSAQNVPQVCNGTQWMALGHLNPAAGGAGCTTPAGDEGELLYNGDFHVLQYCDGDDWVAAHGYDTSGGSLTGPAGCANMGDLCADGTVFAGWHPITYDHLFIPTVDQEQPGSPGTYTMTWKIATGTDDISPDSENDGAANLINRAGAISNFPAFQACEDLSFGGQTDWYLPSRVELFYIWSVHDKIEAGGNITNFQNAVYWSSTEYSTNGAWVQDFTTGYQSSYNKTGAYRVRCARR